jgi:uncharacterized membrane protein
MENTQTPQQPYNERRGLALAGMIIGLVGFLCAFIEGWRMFAIFISFVGLIVSIISLQKAMKHKKNKTKQVVGVLSSIAAIAIAGYFLYTGPDEKHILEGDKMPVNAHDDGVPGSKDENLNKVKDVIDSTYTE